MAPTEGFPVKFRIGIHDLGKWKHRAEGREAILLINGLDALTVLQGLADGRPVHAMDLRAVIGPDGEIICLRSTESKAAEVAAQNEGSRIVRARIETISSAKEFVISEER
jgi:hypothetical protein